MHSQLRSFASGLPVRPCLLPGPCPLWVVSGQSGDGRPASVQWSNPDCQYTLPTPREVAAHVGATAAGRFSASGLIGKAPANTNAEPQAAEVSAWSCKAVLGR
jgi:hypothetical protein